MSTTARKARKRSGIPFVKAQKVATPLENRSDPKLQKRLDAEFALLGK